MREKIGRVGEFVEVVYDRRRWSILRKKRRKTLEIMKALVAYNLNPIVHGSIARGDVRENSDIDVVLLEPVPSYIVEIALEAAGFRPVKKLIVQATPSHTPKAYIALDEEEEKVVSFPLAKLGTREYEFYMFGGLLRINDLIGKLRVKGVDKRLMLIEPTPEGHIESSIIGRESEVAKILGVSVDTVLERVRVLTRRDEKGRTGVFIKHVLPPDVNIEEALEYLKKKYPLLRRKMHG